MKRAKIQAADAAPSGRTFRAFPETPFPVGFEDWLDVSWGNDGAASCMTPCPSKRQPTAHLVLYVADATDRGEMPGKFILERWPDEYACDPRTERLYVGDDEAALTAALALARKEATR